VLSLSVCDSLRIKPYYYCAKRGTEERTARTESVEMTVVIPSRLACGQRIENKWTTLTSVNAHTKFSCRTRTEQEHKRLQHKALRAKCGSVLLRLWV
jgi:hypothetical protein